MRFVEFKASILLTLLLISISAYAELVPPNLTAMAKDLYLQNVSKLTQATGDPEQDEILKRTQKILKKAGVRYWKAEPVRQQGIVNNTATVIGADLNKPEHWARLNDLLAESKRELQVTKLEKWLRDTGKSVDDDSFKLMLANFDKARNISPEQLPHSHSMAIEESGLLNFNWDSTNNEFELQVIGHETVKGKNDGFDLRLNSKVISSLATEGDDSFLSIDKQAMTFDILSDKERQELKKINIKGKWQEDDGTVWEITGTDATIEYNNTVVDSNKEILQLKQKIKDMENQKHYIWENINTGERIKQTKFKRLDERFDYLGEALVDENGDKEIKRMKNKVNSLANNQLPVDSYDPNFIQSSGNKEGAESIDVKVTFSNGYSYRYEQAMISQGVIRAKRTLKDMRDITELPKSIVSQLISSWSPPEWIELEAAVNSDNSQVYLRGKRWRLHVSWSPLYDEISSIHSPYSRKLNISKPGIKSAEGAELKEKL